MANMKRDFEFQRILENRVPGALSEADVDGFFVHFVGRAKRQVNNYYLSGPRPTVAVVRLCVVISTVGKSRKNIFEMYPDGEM